MKPLKILLLGKNGQVGWELQRSLAPLGEMLALDRLSQSHCGDLTHPEGLAAMVRAWQPDVIVNAAAYTGIDKCESEVAAARLVNATAAGVLAEEAQKLGAWLVHYSTDYVFDGSGEQPGQETDGTAPLNVYGQTKLEGEALIAARCDKHIIFRTSWVYAARGGNFAKTMLGLGRERERSSVINDQWGAPTGAELLADVTAHAVRQVTQSIGRAFAGTYHLAASGQATWHAYAKHVLDFARAAGTGPEIKTIDVAAVPTSAFRTPARRPHNSRLNTAKLQAVFGLHLPPWQQGVDRMRSEIL